MKWELFAIRMAILFLCLQIIEELKTFTWPDTLVQIHRCAWDMVGWTSAFFLPVMLVLILGVVDYHPWMYLLPQVAGFGVATGIGLRRVQTR